MTGDDRHPIKGHGRRGPATFRQRDITVAIRGAERAGKQVYAAEIASDGTIRIIVMASNETIPGRNPWDEDNAA